MSKAAGEALSASSAALSVSVIRHRLSARRYPLSALRIVIVRKGKSYFFAGVAGCSMLTSSTVKISVENGLISPAFRSP